MSTRSERWLRVSALFDELVELPPAERARRLDAITREDAALAAEVAALLAADNDEASLLDDDVAAAVPQLLDTEVPADRRAGPYRLLHPLGEGGMGVVWLAERTDGAYEQRVAVKLLKLGMDTHALLRRFLQERHILARLHHAHIVRLVDGGMSTDGRPYYVMDYVDGQPITHYADAHRLDLHERVRLLVLVADAVAYAHAQLVVHRDLKPSNVLVDTNGEPRVLDFGIAKLLEPSGEQTRTGTGQRVLSPAYAAPEQILGEPVGTATDVYALGLMLCELLVGQLPQRRRAATSTPTPAQLAKDAEQGDVERPSLIAARLTPAQAGALYGTHETPAGLSRRLAGDLDVIAGSALQREPERRYATAAAFADDLRRWLDGRPIGARADSGAYRLAKFMRRHRAGVAAGMLVALSLLIGLGAALWQARVARLEAQRADEARAGTERELARAERVKDFILALFREQDPIARAKAQARTPTELIRDGVTQVEATLAPEPALRAALLRDLGEIQLSLDDRKGGEATLKRALDLQTGLSGAGSAATAETLATYADAIYATGDMAKAGSTMRDAVTRLRATRGADHPKTAQAESRLAIIELIEAHYDEAERLARHAIDVHRTAFGADSAELAPLLSTLGNIQQETGHLDEALATYAEALAIVTRINGSEHVRTVTLHSRIGDVQRSQRKFDEALQNYQTALRIERAQLPPGHTTLGGTLLRLGDLQRRMGRLDDADRSLVEAIGVLGTTPSGQYAQAVQFHADLARAQGRTEVAIERYRTSVKAFRATVGDGIYTWLTELKLVEALIDADRLDEADPIAAEAVAAISRATGDNGYDTAYTSSVMGALRHAQGRDADAVPLYRTNLALLLKIYGEAHREVAQARIALASCLIEPGNVEALGEAAALLATAKDALDHAQAEDGDATFGSFYLERARLRHAEGDVAGARSDLGESIRRLQAPAHAPTLRRAKTLERQLGLRT